MSWASGFEMFALPNNWNVGGRRVTARTAGRNRCRTYIYKVAPPHTAHYPSCTLLSTIQSYFCLRGDMSEPPATKTVRVAVTQAEPEWLDLDASIKKTCGLIEEAAANGSKIVAFPECWIPGYPAYIWCVHLWSWSAQLIMSLTRSAKGPPGRFAYGS